MSRRLVALTLTVAGAVALVGGCREKGPLLPVPGIEWGPEWYVCYRTDVAPTLDGKPDEAMWKTAWTAPFVDVLGGERPEPRFRTRVAMLWDDSHLYVAAELEEPHVRATQRERDFEVQRDEVFGVFIDPDGDTHYYFELAINAFGAERDVLLEAPFRDGGRARPDWRFERMRTAVHVDGTLDDPGDEDAGWSVEIAIPWAAMEAHAYRETPPSAGDQWRVNFFRVEQRAGIRDGAYAVDGGPGELSVWSPQGLADLHYPEMWGFVQFSDRVAGSAEEPFVEHTADRARWALRRLYYAERHWHAEHGRFSYKPEQLGLTDPGLEGWSWPPEIVVGDRSFVARIHSESATIEIWHNGRTR